MQTKSFILAIIGLLLASLTGVRAKLSDQCFQDWYVERSSMIIRCATVTGGSIWSRLDMDVFLANSHNGNMLFQDG